MDQYGGAERPIDVLFVGGYSRHHSVRARVLEQVASLARSGRSSYCLDASRLTRLAESAIGRLLPLRQASAARVVADIAKPPVFGRQLYELLGSIKDRAERCNRHGGRGSRQHALLRGHGLRRAAGVRRRQLSGRTCAPGETMQTYDSAENASAVISEALTQWPRSAELARRGRDELSSRYTANRSSGSSIC